MFCKNCGKELREGIWFCEACGAQIEGDGTVPGRINMPGITVDHNWSRLQKIVEDNRKRKSKWRIITAGLSFFLLWMTARNLLGTAESILEGGSSPSELLLAGITGIFIVSLLLYILFILIGTVKIGKKNYRECLHQIRVSDSYGLLNALRQMNCPVVETVSMDERGNIFVGGRKAKYAFTQKQEMLELDLYSGKNRDLLRRDTIAVDLLKYLAPDCPLDAADNRKDNEILRKLLEVCPAILIASLALLLLYSVFSG
ncbi:MAG TPA: hypothetical protein DDY31_12420 [Lachnospiraceae bacterium]|nr:hypothetical protein [Lachnospiraceae bacterium]HBI61995.1 hypothetical protein [Lachnospiraceae bacterium]